MSQNATPEQTVLDPAESSTESTSSPELPNGSESGLFASSNDFSVDSYADRLMDELFDDLEDSLDRGAKLPTEPVQPDYVSLEALSIPQMDLPPVLVPRPSMDDEPDLATIEAESGLVPIPVDNRRGFGQSFDKLLLAIGGVSVIATVFLWFSFQDRNQSTNFESAKNTPPANGNMAPSANQEFLQYMQRSLQVIDRKADLNQQIPNNIPPNGAVASLPSASLPTVPVQGGLPQPASNTSAMPPERVYIPVYQPPQVTAPAPALQPSAASNAPAAPAAPASPGNVAAVGSIPNIAPGAVTYTMVGVFESSDPSRSAALFEGNGTTQRIYVGEAIGGSGWTLVSVDNDEAIVRRNGEVRSIYAGQQF
ncbi:MAG TPA: type II secretion system protein N [Crinalium sp.]|jgi:hypothetical protein